MEEEPEHMQLPGIIRSCQCKQCRATRELTSTKNRRFWKRLFSKKRRKSSEGDVHNHYWA